MKRVCSKWSSEDLDRAVSAVQRGDMGLNKAAEAYGLPKSTLSRLVKRKNKFAKGNIKHHGHECIFTEEHERELVNHCLSPEAMYFGLCIEDLRRLAFDLTEANALQHCFNKEDKMAGKKWYYVFMKRHPEPEGTSMARAQGFNRERVHSFFKLLERVYNEEKLTQDRLFNMDETSLSTAQDGQSKVLTQRGKRRAEAMTSNEWGESITSDCSN